MNSYYILKCDKLFRKTTQRFFGEDTRFQQERTFWSLVCEVLAGHPEGLTKNEIIDKIGYCSSQSQVWVSLKENGYVERIPHSWKLRLTHHGLNHITNVFKENGLELDTSVDHNKHTLYMEQRSQGKMKTINNLF